MDGWLYPREASVLMAHAAGQDVIQAAAFEAALIHAVSTGELKARNPVTRLVAGADSKDCVLLLADLNAWIEGQGVRYQVILAGEITPGAAGPATAAGMPEAVPAAKAHPQGNTTKTPRSDAITPVIKLAQDKSLDPCSTSQVWAQMQVLAQNEHAPFLASTENGLKYHRKGTDAYFTRKALDKRLHPEKRSAHKVP